MQIIEATGLDRKSGERSGEICGVRARRDELSSSSILFQARLMRQTQGEAISKNTL
jgi:hypothetical protein